MRCDSLSLPVAIGLTVSDFVERLKEREAIMADSNIVDIKAAFGDSERWRIRIEAAHCLDWYSLEERRNYLEECERWRGEVGRKCLEKAILEEWNRRKAA